MFRITVLSILILLASCTNKTIYSGKILNQADLTNINFKNILESQNKLLKFKLSQVTWKRNYAEALAKTTYLTSTEL